MFQRNRLSRALKFSLFIFLFVQFSGCIFIPIIDGVKKVGLTRSDREALLTPRVKEFQDLIYWNKFQRAAAMIRDDVRGPETKLLSQRFKGFRLVDSTVDFLDFSDDSNEATVTVTARRFKVPYYIVEEYVEDQKWEFSISNGWVFVSAAQQESAQKQK